MFKFAEFLKSEFGATAIEYALIVTGLHWVVQSEC